jgi:hypothetical protein
MGAASNTRRAEAIGLDQALAFVRVRLGGRAVGANRLLLFSQ